MASFPVWTREDHERFKLALAQFPDGSPSFLDDIAKHLQKPLEEVTHYYNDFYVPKLHRLVRWSSDDHNRFVSAREQFEGSPSFLDDIAKHLHKPLLEVKHYNDKINPDKDDLPHNPDQESDSEDDNVTETETRKRQRTDQEDEDHRLDDNVLVTEASQRQRTQDQQHRLDDNVLVAEASQRQRNQDQQHRLDDNVLVTEASLRQRNQDQQHMLDDNVLVTEASLRQRTQDQQHRLDDNVPVAEASKPQKNDRSWTREEHILFLEGLDYYKKGKWKEISRDFVKTRTSTQVASHAQKYEKRQKLESKEGRRPSILDITLESIKGKPNFGKKDPPDDDGSSGSCLGV